MTKINLVDVDERWDAGHFFVSAKGVWARGHDLHKILNTLRDMLSPEATLCTVWFVPQGYGYEVCEGAPSARGAKQLLVFNFGEIK